LIICCDGTWNTPTETRNGKACPTNVSKTATAIAPEDAGGISQVAYYHPGVGTNWYNHIGGGVFGIGLSRAIKDCYGFLAQNYKTGEDLYFFGFSRGAYTARSLLGLSTNAASRRHHGPIGHDIFNNRHRRQAHAPDAAQ
jgi:uncharacterized protein (DUF2235 family)